MRWLGACLLAWGCGGEPAPTEDAPAAPIGVIEQPDVLFVGCVDVHAGKCLLGKHDSELRIWIDTQPYVKLTVTADGGVVTPTSTPAGGGLRLTVPVAADVEHLELTGADPAWSEPWTLAIERVTASVAFTRAEKLRIEDGDLQAAEAVLREAIPTLEGFDKLAALEWLVNAKATPERVEAVVKLAEELDRPRTAGRAASALFRTRAQKGEFDKLDSLVARIAKAGEELDEVRVWAHLEDGHWASTLGNPSEAIRSAETALRLAIRLGQNVEIAAALGDLVGAYVTVGDWEKVELRAEMLDSRAAGSELTCAQRTSAYNSIGWAYLHGYEAGQTRLWAEPPLESALWLARDEGECPNPHEEVNIRINLALYALQQDDGWSALRWLEPVIDPPADFAPWIRDVRTRAGLKLDLIEYAATPLEIVSEERLGDRYNAWVSRARLLEHLGAIAAAADAWSEAESLVDEQAAAIDVGGARDRYVERRLASASGLVRALVRGGDLEQALCRARLARGRLLRLVDHGAALSRVGEERRKRWRTSRIAYAKIRAAAMKEAAGDWRYSEEERQVRSRRRREAAEGRATAAFDEASRALHRRRAVSRCEDLPPIPSGTAQLVLFPDDKGWWVFVGDADGVDVNWVATLDPETVLSARVARRVLEAERLRVVPTGESWDLAVPRVRAGDKRLLDVGPLVYALDLASTARPQSGHALIIADPSGDLEHARHEATAVETALRSKAWAVQTLSGPAATRDAVVSSMVGASLMHYAGHGRHRGDAGWESALVFNGQEALTVQDVLLLPEVPRSVVLTGCETGATTSGVLTGGMSLGRAFVLAGAGQAVVASESVDDSLARHVGTSLYSQPGRDDHDLAAALRRVQLELRASQPGSDWWAFRVVVR